MELLCLHPKQREIIASEARWKVIRAGRKGGKTAMEVENIVFKATASIKLLNLQKKEFATGRKVLYIAPTQDQARKIVWEYLKKRLSGVGKANEQRLEMKVPNEDKEFTTILIGGYENRENYRGLTDVIHIVFDEVDTLKNFFLSWKDIFRPMFLDTAGTADFIGTPKKENPNLKRLEKEFADGINGESFHFTSKDNPYLPVSELALMELEYQGDRESYEQEVLAEYITNKGALFNLECLVDTFTNTITKENERYLIVDIADDGSDKTVFSFWEGLEEYRRESFDRLNTENIIMKIREYTMSDKIPYSQVAVDAIGVGAGVASSSMLDGIIGYKSSYSAVKTEPDIVRLPNVSYLNNANMITDYRNLRSQCIFKLSQLVNNHLIASRITGNDKEKTIEELSAYQDVSKGDGKRMATATEDVKAIIGRSPDHASVWIMRMYFELMSIISPHQSEDRAKAKTIQLNQFAVNESSNNSNK